MTMPEQGLTHFEKSISTDWTHSICCISQTGTWISNNYFCIHIRSIYLIKKNPLLFCHGRFKYKAAAFLKNISSKDSRCTGVKGFLILTSSITLVQLKKGIFHCNHFHYIYLIFSFSNKSYWLWKIQQYCKT